MHPFMAEPAAAP